MCELMVLIIWAVLGVFVEVCGAPAVSLSFGAKSKNDTGVVFAYRNGSWVSVGAGRTHSVKSSSQTKKDGNYTSEFEDLFRRINLTLPRKMAPTYHPVPGTSEKPLGELFLEWLSKHEGTVKPVAALKSTPIPVVGLQIDFDESPSARATGRDFAKVTSHPKLSFVDIPLLLGQPVKKAGKSYDPLGKSRASEHRNAPIDRPINYYLEPEISQVNQKGPDSDDDLKTQFYVRKRRGKSDIDDSVRFIIEPLTILPFDLVNSDLELSNFQSSMSKRDAKSSDNNQKHITLLDAQNVKQEDVKLSETHSRHQRSYIEFTPVPAKAQSVQPVHKMPKFDEALPVESHVKKRHGKLFLNPKSEGIGEVVTPIPAAEESYSGQLLVRNEIPGDRKNNLNDLPKYVMKFLSQCKALIEQNYDEGTAKDNYNDEALLSHNDSPNDKTRVMPKSATDRTSLANQAATTNAEVDEFESISINKIPMKKSKNGKGAVQLPIDRGDSGTDGWAQTGHPKVINGHQSKMEHKNLLSAYEGDDLYDEDLDFHIGDSNRQSEEKVSRKTYYTSNSNASSCRAIIENYAPSTVNYTPCGSEEPEVTTLSSEQWKLLMDMLNERVPYQTMKCTTTCPGKKKTASRATTACTTDVTWDSNRNKIAPPRQKSDSGKTADSKSTTNATPMQNKPTTCQTIETTCATTTTPTTTAATTLPTCTSTTTCATTTTEGSTTRDDCNTEAPTEECTETPAPRNVKQKNKPAMPQRYLIKIETPKPKHYNELSHLQGRSKPNNWFDNIKNLKLLEGLRSNQNPMKASYNVLHPKSSGPGMQNDPESAERMIAEGVIPLKTGSTLNLYISYVLNKTKAHKGTVPIESNVLDDKQPAGASVPRKPFHDAKVQGAKR